MLIKSRRALAATAVALAAAAGASAVAVLVASSSTTAGVSPGALPSAAGPAATAAVPRGGGGADGAGQAAVPGRPAGTAAPGPSGPQTAAPGNSAQQAASPAGSPATGSGSDDGNSAAALLPRSAGQGDAGPLAAGTIPADGAVPGAGAAFRQLAAARAAQTVLPHSPQLLAQLGGGQSAGPAGGSSAGASTDALVTGTAAPAGKTLAGLDVAQFQHPVTTAYPSGQAITWPSVARAGYKFAAVKATEGDYYVNPWAATDLAGSKAAGLDVAPYHFAVPNESSGPAQAKFAVQYSGYRSGTRMLPLMLDIEYDPYTSTDHTNQCYGLSTIKMKAWISAFVTEAKTLTSQYPLIYTTASWWDTCTARATAFGAGPMWVAAYGTSAPPLPVGWKLWTFWQHSAAGTVPGVNATGSTDMDYFSPAAVGLISPGTLSTRAKGRVWLQLGCLGATAGEQLTYQVSGLPPGLSISRAGALGGTIKSSAAASTGKTYLVTVAARNTAGVTAKVKFSWKVSPA